MDPGRIWSSSHDAALNRTRTALQLDRLIKEHRSRFQQRLNDGEHSPDDSELSGADDPPDLPSMLTNLSVDGSTPGSINAKPKLKLEKLDPKLVGMSVGFKNLYSGKEDKHGRFQWQDKIPEDVRKPAEDAETQKWALVVRFVKVYNDPRKSLGMHSILIQSPLLKKLLEDVLAGYPGVTVGLQRLEFAGKFEPLIHRFSELKAAIAELKTIVGDQSNEGAKVSDATQGETEVGVYIPGEEALIPDNLIDKDSLGSDGKDGLDDTDILINVAAKENMVVVPTEPAAVATPTSVDDAGEGTATESQKGEEAALDNHALQLRHAELLQEVLLGEFQTLLDSSQDMKSQSVISYDILWTIFQPGTMIFARQDGQERIFRLTSGKYGFDKDDNPVFWVSASYIDHDGSRFGYKMMTMNISGFNGTRPISSLSAFPLEFHSDQEQLRQRLVERGSKVEGYTGTHYRSYDGIGWKLNAYGDKEKFSVSGRIIVDALGWNRYNPNFAVYVTPLNKKGASQVPGLRLRLFGGSSITSRSYMADSDAMFGDGCDDCGGGMPMDGHFGDDEDTPTPQPLTDDQKLICTPLIRSYCLKEKSWLNLFVNSVHDITFNSRAFQSLVLPENQKELILGFTSTQQSYRNTYDDVIEGKGRGIIILLCGPPGVGKTLTAESVAEEMKVPLFIMAAGDLGVDSRHIEARLLSVLGMCTRWNAILLLDEAEVFLEARSTHELERNKIVSIFLRVLEYHEGIMFLTTNRVTTFDPAFHSRIHISLDYQELSAKSRKTVWENFLKKHDEAQAASKTRPPKNSASAIKTDHNTDSQLSEEDQRKLHESRTQSHAITDRQLKDLSSMSMNGRQIKNILKTAQLLASRKGEALQFSHIRTVLDVTQHLHNETKQSQSTLDSLFS